MIDVVICVIWRKSTNWNWHAYFCSTNLFVFLSLCVSVVCCLSARYQTILEFGRERKKIRMQHMKHFTIVNAINVDGFVPMAELWGLESSCKYHSVFSLFSIRCCSMWTTNNLLIMFIESKNNACDLRHNSNNSDWMRFDVITFYYSLTSIQFSHDGKLFAYRKYDEVVQIYYNPPAKYCMLMLTGRSIQFENWWI